MRKRPELDSGMWPRPPGTAALPAAAGFLPAPNTPPESAPTAFEAVRDGGIAYGPAIAVRVTEG
ncbi:hypothetical protein [Streptomyces goshikiensis]|uniref:hypothetical protein n=1 Tax=Streptomyces goshikiensis TaxID=1942 RepID=UPI0036A3780E